MLAGGDSSRAGRQIADPSGGAPGTGATRAAGSHPRHGHRAPWLRRLWLPAGIVLLSVAYLVSILPLSDSARNYPLAVVCGLLVVTVGGAVRENLATRTAALDSHESAQADVGESTSSLLLTVVLFGVLIVLATRFGVLVAMAVCVPTQLLALNERSLWKLAAATLAVIAVTYFVLYRLLQIPIPL